MRPTLPTQAGAIVQQSVAQIRTVAAYNGEDAARAKYDSLLDAPQKVRRRRLCRRHGLTMARA